MSRGSLVSCIACVGLRQHTGLQKISYGLNGFLPMPCNTDHKLLKGLFKEFIVDSHAARMLNG